MSSKQPIVDVIIPAYNEEASIARVINDIPRTLVREIIVCDNNSTDRTAAEGAAAGGKVVWEGHPGYGSACLRGLHYLSLKAPQEQPDIVVFIDGDYSDDGTEMPRVVAPIIERNFDMVIGSRALGEAEDGSMTVPQIFGNWLATNLIRLFYGYEFTDLGPFRAIRYARLVELGMTDRDYGWTVEMQVKAARAGLACTEVPVSYRRRIGTSKISGTVKGTLLAGHKILWTIFKLL